MPITKSAKKALRVSKRRREENKRREKRLKEAMKTFRAKPSKSLLGKVFGALDRAVDAKVLHKNKAARLKSRFSKLA